MFKLALRALFFGTILFFQTTPGNALQEKVKNYDPNLQSIVDELNQIGAIRSGEFTLKSKLQTNYYIDLRSIISRPKLLKKVSRLMLEKMKNIPCDALCGVPYGALPLSTAMSLDSNQSMLLLRKEVKNHGTKQSIEGIYQRGDLVLIIDDVISSGESIAETARMLRSQGLIVQDAVVFLDRNEGGNDSLLAQEIRTHSLLTISELLFYLEHSKIKSSPPETLSYTERAQITTHPIARDLFLLMEEKQTNLAIAADIVDKKELLILADTVGPYICIFKTHADIIENFDDEFIQNLQLLANKHRFFLFEDRKFADIGNTTAMQYKGGIHKISSWADIINAHSLPGPGIIEALKKENQTDNRALLLIPQLSSSGALTDDDYAKKTISLAEENADFVIGFIARKRLTDHPHFLYLTPGISLSRSNDSLGQQYITPDEAITNNGSDIIIVGRSLYESENLQIAAEQYRSASWNAYLKRMIPK